MYPYKIYNEISSLFWFFSGPLLNNFLEVDYVLVVVLFNTINLDS